jgi:hypothetical protein
MLFRIGIKLGVSPNLISNRLLSLDDKNDMLSGELKDHELELHVQVWKDAGMPDYKNGTGGLYKASKR